jgi:hypothetical protein
MERRCFFVYLLVSCCFLHVCARIVLTFRFVVFDSNFLDFMRQHEVKATGWHRSLASQLSLLSLDVFEVVEP